MRQKTARKYKRPIISKPNEYQHMMTQVKIDRQPPIKARKSQTIKYPIFKSNQKKHPAPFSSTAPVPFRNVRSLAMVSAYQPIRLTSCIIKNQKTYSQFFSNNSNTVFIGSIIAHFKQWRGQINKQLQYIFNKIQQNDQVIQNNLQEQVRPLLEKLKETVSILNSSISGIIIQSDNKNTQIIQMSSQYEALSQHLQHIVNLIDWICRFSLQIKSFLTSDSIDITKEQEIQKQLDCIIRKSKKKAKFSLNYCYDNHSSYEMLNRINENVKKKLAKTKQNALSIFDSLRKIQYFHDYFKVKLEEFQNGPLFTIDYLTDLIEFLDLKNKQIKDNQQQFYINKQVNEKVTLVRKNILASLTIFIRHLRSKYLRDIQESIKILNDIRILQLIRNKGKQYGYIKKKFTLFLKVLNESEQRSGINQQIYEKQKREVMQTKKSIEHYLSVTKDHVSQLISGLSHFVFQKQKNRNIKVIHKELKIIQRLQKLIWGSLSCLYKQICKIQNIDCNKVIQNQYNDSNLIQNYLQLIQFSKSQENNNIIFTSLNSNNFISQEKTQIQAQSILKEYNNKFQHNKDFLENNLQIGCKQQAELKKLANNQLITQLIGNELQNEFISNYPIIKTMVNLNSKTNNAVVKEQIKDTQFYLTSESLLNDYIQSANNCINEIQKGRFRPILKKYIIFLYESNIIHILNIQLLFDLHNTKQSSFIGDNQAFNHLFQNYIIIYQTILQKSKIQNNSFRNLIKNIYRMTKIMKTQNQFVYQYNNSVETNKYFPSALPLIEWLQIQYKAQIQDTISLNQVLMKRQYIRGIFQLCLQRLEQIKQKINTNQIFNRNHKIYRKINQTIVILKKFTFEQNYEKLASMILQYMRAKDLPHSAMFTNNQQPLVVFTNIVIPNQIMMMLMLKLNLVCQKINPRLLSPFQINSKPVLLQFKSQSRSMTKTPQKYKQQYSFLRKKTSLLINNKQSSPDSIQQVPKILIEPITSQQNKNISLIQMRKSAIGQQLIKNNKIGDNSSTILRRQSDRKKTYSYWKLSLLQDVSKLKNCLIYKQDKTKMISKMLDIKILFKIHSLPQKTEEICKHLDQVLKWIRQNDLVKIFNIDYTQSQSELQVISLQKAVQDNSVNIIQTLNNLLQHFKFKKEILYKRGKNIIEAVSKENQDSHYIFTRLRENNYKKNMVQFKINAIVETIWEEIKNCLVNSQQISPKIDKTLNILIQQSNNAILQYYKAIQAEFNLFRRIKVVNTQQIQSEINYYLTNVIKFRTFLSPLKARFNSLQSFIQYLSDLSSQITDIFVFSPAHSLVCGGKMLYIHHENISEYIIQKCLMTKNRFEQKTQDKMIINNGYVMTIKNGYLADKILKLQCEKQRITFQHVKKCIQGNVQVSHFLAAQKTKRQQLIKMRKYQPFLQLIEDASLCLIKFQRVQLQKQLQFLNHLLQTGEIRPVYQWFDKNKDIQYVEINMQTGRNKIFPKQKLYILGDYLKVNKIEHSKVMFKDKNIGLISYKNTKEVAQILNIREDFIDKIIEEGKQIIVEKEKIIIQKIYLTVSKIVPIITHKDKATVFKIQQYLGKTTVKVQTDGLISQFSQYNCLQLFTHQNEFRIILPWPKENIKLSLCSTNDAIQINLTPNQYHYYTVIKLLPFQQHLQHKYKQIEQEVISDRKKEKERKRQEKLREQQERQLRQSFLLKSQIVKLGKMRSNHAEEAQNLVEHQNETASQMQNTIIE